jgi:2-aminoadipate transaminase
MRLNFSGVGEDSIREGVRRIGAVVREQVALYGTLTGRPAGAPRRTAGPARGGAGAPGHEPVAEEAGAGGRLVHMPRRAQREQRSRRL